jgi:TonB family protein
MTAPRSRRRRRLGPALIVSGLVHVQVLALLGVTAFFTARRNAALRAEEPIDVMALDDEASRAIVAELERRQEQQAEEEKKKEEESPTAPNQVVDSPGPPSETPPKEARYAAEHDTSTEHETHRRGAPEQRRPQPSQPGLLAMRAPTPRTPPPGTAGRPGGPPTPSGQSPETESAPPPAVEGRPGGPPAPPPRPGAVALMPSSETLSRALGAGTSDYLPDVDEGSDTALNAKRWKFASFFNRVKEQIRQHWHAAQEYQKRDPTGTLYGGKVRFTVLRVALMPDGSLADVHLEKGSGVDFLDDVAMTAVKEAQPFPNPPQQLVDPKLGKISFKFGFVVDVTGETRTRVYRYSSM